MLQPDEAAQNRSILISNLNESTTLADLEKLVAPFGPTRTIYLGQAEETGLCSGFAYVNFRFRRHAVRAISKLDGSTHEHLILHVEWSKLREEEMEEQDSLLRSRMTSLEDSVEECNRLRKCHFKKDKVRFVVDDIFVEFKQRKQQRKGVEKSLDFFHPYGF